MAKWEELNLTEKELNDRCMTKGSMLKPCTVCGTLTQYLDYCYESRMCSEECQRKQDTEMNGSCNTDIPEEPSEEEIKKTPKLINVHPCADCGYLSSDGGCESDTGCIVPDFYC